MLKCGNSPCFRPWRPLKLKLNLISIGLPTQSLQVSASNLNTRRMSSPVASLPTPVTRLRRELDGLAPRIDIEASQIQVIHSPGDFYATLKTKIASARKRIFLSTLYIGRSEHELVGVIRTALEKHEDLQVSILTDALRGTRESPNETSCASLLLPLVRDFPERVQVRMYHTPNLTGLRKALIPKRINEGWGLQHMKLYGFDDEVMLSGANLSSDYFTNRQDRYHLFQSEQVADYFETIHTAVCSLSQRLETSVSPSGFALTWPSSNKAQDPLKFPARYKSTATSLLRPLVSSPSAPPPASKTNTSIYPLLVHPPTINTELPAIETLLSLSHPIQSYTFTAGYFNPHPIVTSTLLNLSSAPSSVPGTILTASPHANGFFGSAGISGMLPAAYSRLSLVFLRAARGKNIRLREWQRGVVGKADGWTYHGKGLWVTISSAGKGLKEEDVGPSATLIGSSNYTTRSYGLDLEVGAMVVTTDEGLRKKWKAEVENLAQYTQPVGEKELEDKDRKASLKVRIAMWIVRKVGGAL